MNSKYGILTGPSDPAPQELDLFRSLGLGAVKLLCGIHSPKAIESFRNVGAYVLQARIVYPDINNGRTPAQFVADRRNQIEAFIKAGLGEFELLNEPNTTREGFGKSWNSSDEFNIWFIEAANRLRDIFPGIRLGFPGLSPGSANLNIDPITGRTYRPVGDVEFLDACNDAVLNANYLGVHAYWNNVDEMRDFDPSGTGIGGLRWVRLYHERFPTMTIAVTDFSNMRAGVGDYAPNDDQWRVIGNEYAEFYTLCAQYEWLTAAFARVLRDPSMPDQSWMTPAFETRRIAEGVNARPNMPDPSQLSLRWPTDFRRITQPYGMRQLDYARFSGNYLHGGHEGVDIAAPTSSNIYSCLDGMVVRSEATKGSLKNGYGAYGEVIGVESSVAGVGKVMLTYAHFKQRLAQVGNFVRAGDLLGLADETGNAQGSHLHLSMRIEGISVYAQLDYLNAGPYLNIDDAPPPPPPPAPGQPRVQYARTVVLLPPPAGVDYVEAVLNATWERHRYTVGGSSDDGGIGDLDRRRVIAVNPQLWNGDLRSWYQQNYAGIDYVPIQAANPAALASVLRGLTLGEIPIFQGANRGAPLTQYKRTCIIIPPTRGVDWALTVARSTWAKYRMTIGGSSDDGGIGALNNRRVVALNPNEWGGDLQAWYLQNYPGVEYVPVSARDTADLMRQLLTMFP